MNRRSLVFPLLLVELAVTAEVIVLTSGASPLRVALALWFILVAPGWAVLRALDLPMGVLAMAATAVAISVSIDILVAMALFYARWWSVERAMTILLAMVVVLVMADLPIVRRAVRRVASANPVRCVMRP
jgi:uncharacterized membrane protein